jgi:cytochrome c-type biogenesis protein CcmH
MGALALAFLAAPALPSERHPTLAELEGEVMCPVCNTTLDQSNSQAARRIESYIGERIAAGDTRSKIKARLVAQFGPSILASPPRHGFNLVAWWLPIVGVGAGAVALAIGAWRWSRTAESRPRQAESESGLEPELERRIDEELARF